MTFPRCCCHSLLVVLVVDSTPQHNTTEHQCQRLIAVGLLEVLAFFARFTSEDIRQEFGSLLVLLVQSRGVTVDQCREHGIHDAVLRHVKRPFTPPDVRDWFMDLSQHVLGVTAEELPEREQEPQFMGEPAAGKEREFHLVQTREMPPSSPTD